MKNKREVFILKAAGQEEQRKPITGMRLIVGSLLMIGFLLSFYAFYYTLPAFWLILLVSLLAEIVLVVCMNSSRAARISFGGVTALAVILLAINITGFGNALIYLLNQFLTVWNSRFDTYLTLFVLSGCSDMQRLLFWLVCGLLGVLLLGCLLRAGSRLTLTVLILGFLFLSIALHTGIGAWCTVLTILGWFLFWVMDVAEHQHFLKIVQIFAVFTLCCGIVAIGTNSYTEIQGVTDLRKSIIHGADRIRFGEDTLPQGDLTKADKMVGDDSETLQLNFKKAQEMYLRGFVGSDYNGSGWSEASGAIYAQEDTSGMLDWLEDQGFETVCQYAAYQKASKVQTQADNALSVNNVGAYRRYIYAPYEMASWDAGVKTAEKDWQMQSSGLFGAGEYSYDLMKPDMPSELIVAKPIDSQTEEQKNYVRAEHVYRTFVYQNYLNVSDEEKTLLDELIYANEDWSNANIYQLTSQIRIALQGMVSYTDSPDAYGGKEDFVNWFLTKEKNGNAASYATVATLAYRMMGIPARYVEGYYLTDAAAAGLNDRDATSATLTQKDAHAWTEVYMDEVGWMPVEVVPGFYIADYTTTQELDIPQSSVTIQNQEEQEELQGNTTDQLDTEKKDKNTEESVVKKTVRIVGIVLLVLMTLMLCYLFLQLQQKIRIQLFSRRLKRGSSAVIGGLLYDRVCLIFHIDRIPGDVRFPYEHASETVEGYEGISEADYIRFISLIQKERFGGNVLAEAECHTLKIFTQRLSEASYHNADLWKRLRMKYWYCIHE
ncbi:MAG: transglutaminase-like domain-containing protein [Hespellia sp.]|nr:transglutaminase-like domain-containing protein [Hespellia sp.]